jgi:tetratricopeptide (TPR) repeat protein
MIFQRNWSCGSMDAAEAQPMKPTNVHQPESLQQPSKPFFIMDWLDQMINETDLTMAQKIIQTPPAKQSVSTVSTLASAYESSPTSVASKQLTLQTSTANSNNNCWRKRSVAIGNAWNARGLQKAKSGKWTEALVAWENALEIRTQVLGHEHLEVANTCNNMGIALVKLNRIVEAVDYLQRALTIRAEQYGRQHEVIASTLHNLGNVLQAGGELEAAVNCFCETKKLQEHLLGPYHVQVARACIAMGHTYYQATEYNDAREAYLDALLVFERANVSSSNPEVRNTLADVHELNRLLE